MFQHFPILASLNPVHLEVFQHLSGAQGLVRMGGELLCRQIGNGFTVLSHFEPRTVALFLGDIHIEKESKGMQVRLTVSNTNGSCFLFESSRHKYGTSFLSFR